MYAKSIELLKAEGHEKGAENLQNFTEKLAKVPEEFPNPTTIVSSILDYSNRRVLASLTLPDLAQAKAFQQTLANLVDRMKEYIVEPEDKEIGPGSAPSSRPGTAGNTTPMNSGAFGANKAGQLTPPYN